MQHRNLWAVAAGLAWVIFAGGCQSTGGKAGSAVQALGLNSVPRQTEPPLDDDHQGPRTASHDAGDADGEDAARPEKSGRLLTRLLPGREKEVAPRKTLPLTETASGDSDDDFDFE